MNLQRVKLLCETCSTVAKDTSAMLRMVRDGKQRDQNKKNPFHFTENGCSFKFRWQSKTQQAEKKQSPHNSQSLIFRNQSTNHPFGSFQSVEEKKTWSCTRMMNGGNSRDSKWPFAAVIDRTAAWPCHRRHRSRLAVEAARIGRRK